MYILERYIAKNLIITTLVVMLALLGLDLFFYTVSEVRYLGQGQYTVHTLLSYLLLKIPTKLYYLLPWTVVLGTLMGLGGLAKNSELIAMQVAAISKQRIAISTIKGIFLLMLVMFFLGEYVSPKTEMLAQNKKTQALSSGRAINTAYGVWIRNNNEFVHIGTIESITKLFDITRYVFNKDLHLLEVSKAKKAILVDEEWHLEDIKGTKFSANKTEIIENKKLVIEDLLDEEILSTVGVKHIDRLSLSSLYQAIKMRKLNELNASEYELAFWGKIFKPFVIIILAFVSTSFVFGSLRSSSIGLKVLIGAIIGFCFHVLNTVFAPLTVVFNFPPLLAAALPSILFLLFGIYMMKKSA